MPTEDYPNGLGRPRHDDWPPGLHSLARRGSGFPFRRPTMEGQRL